MDLCRVLTSLEGLSLLDRAELLVLHSNGKERGRALPEIERKYLGLGRVRCKLQRCVAPICSDLKDAPGAHQPCDQTHADEVGATAGHVIDPELIGAEKKTNLGIVAVGQHFLYVFYRQTVAEERVIEKQSLRA